MKLFSCAAGALLLASCANAPGARTADVIYVNANVWTGVKGAARAEAVAIAGDKIVYVGDDDGALRFQGEATEIVDLGGDFLAPGFIDNHTHFFDGSFALASVPLNDASSKDEFVRRIADYASSRPKGEWITGGNWDEEKWGGQLPDRNWIDAATPDNPVYIARYDGHMALANSLALQRAGLNDQTPTPDGGEIVRDKKGRITGAVKDKAMEIVEAVIPAPSDAQRAEAFQRGQAEAFAHGVTQVHDMPLPAGGLSNLAALKKLHDDGAMKLRVYVFAPLADWAQVAAFVAENGRGDDTLRWGAVKGYVDGSLGSRTAWRYEKYVDADTTGLTMQAPEQLAEWARAADAAGLHVTIHAIGERANDFVLETFAEIGGEKLHAKRFRVEHAQHLTRAAIARFGEGDIIASVQPYHAADDGRFAVKRIGPEAIKTTYAFRSLLDAGALMTFGSDWPVAPLDPLVGIDAAMFRRTTDGLNPNGWTPEQKISGEEALTAYTAANAYAGFMEDKLGTLEPGKYADIVVLSGDPTGADENTIREITVLRTIVGGDTVFAADQSE
ncbi:MAG: amidohydrolase [Parvularculaceae bacterium]|nr:amidohydrolase [Parvularculaceae bacterium]